MKTIDRFLFEKIATNLFVILAILTSILTLFSFFRATSVTSLNGTTLGHLVTLSVAVVPSYLSSVFPFIIFGVVFFTYLQLKHKKHLIILKTVGLSNPTIMRCTASFALLALALHLFLTLFLSPYAMRQLQITRGMISIESLLKSQKTPKEFQAFSQDITLYFEDIKSDGTLINIFYNNNKNHTTLTAEEGFVSGKELFLHNGTKFQYTPKGSNVITFSKALINLDETEKSVIKYHDWKYFERYLPSLISPKKTHRPLPLLHAQAYFMLLSPLLSLCLIPMAALFVLTMPEGRNLSYKSYISPLVFLVFSFVFFMLMYIKMQKEHTWLTSTLFIISSITPLFITLFHYLSRQKKYEL